MDSVAAMEGKVQLATREEGILKKAMLLWLVRVERRLLWSGIRITIKRLRY